MNKQELETRLNELFAGAGANNMYHMCEFVSTQFASLGIDNGEGEWGTRLSGYEITITYKQHYIVSFKIIRQKNSMGGWLVKQVKVDDDFVDLKTSMQQARERMRYQSEQRKIAYIGCLYENKFEDLQGLLRLIKANYQRKTKAEIYSLIRELENEYWLVDESEEDE